MKYSRNMQSGIYALMLDISNFTGYSAPHVEAYFKRLYWGDRDGSFSLALDKCPPHHATAFFNMLISFVIDNDVQINSWASPDYPAVSPLSWGFDKKEICDLCFSKNVSATTFKKFE